MPLPSVFQAIRGTLHTAFQIGKGGPQIKSDTGKIHARNAADNAYAAIRAAADASDPDAVVVNGQIAGGGTWIKITAGTGATADSTAIIPDGAVISQVVVDVTTAYDNGAELTVGHDADPDAYAEVIHTDAANVGQYVKDGIAPQSAGSGKAVRVSVSNTPTVGAAAVYVQWTTPAT